MANEFEKMISFSSNYQGRASTARRAEAPPGRGGRRTLHLHPPGPPGAQGRRRDLRASQGQEGGGQHWGSGVHKFVWTALNMVFRGKEKYDQQLGAEDPVQKQHFYYLLLKLCCDLSKCIFIFYGKFYDVLCNTYKKEFKYPCTHLPL